MAGTTTVSNEPPTPTTKTQPELRIQRPSQEGHPATPVTRGESRDSTRKRKRRPDPRTVPVQRGHHVLAAPTFAATARGVTCFGHDLSSQWADPARGHHPRHVIRSVAALVFGKCHHARSAAVIAYGVGA